MLGTSAYETSVKYSYSDEDYSTVLYDFDLRRQTLYYMMNFIVPCVLIAVLTVPVLLLPPESQERQSYGVTVLLSFTILIMMLQVRGRLLESGINGEYSFISVGEIWMFFLNFSKRDTIWIFNHACNTEYTFPRIC